MWNVGGKEFPMFDCPDGQMTSGENSMHPHLCGNDEAKGTLAEHCPGGQRDKDHDRQVLI